MFKDIKASSSFKTVGSKFLGCLKNAETEKVSSISILYDHTIKEKNRIMNIHLYRQDLFLRHLFNRNAIVFKFSFCFNVGNFKYLKWMQSIYFCKALRQSNKILEILLFCLNAFQGDILLPVIPKRM